MDLEIWQLTGIDKPVLNVFRMYGKMSGNRVEISGNQNHTANSIRDLSVRGEKTDIGALASKDLKSAAVMLWHYHDDDVAGASQNIEVNLNGLPTKKVEISHYRIDNEHSNSYEVWKTMGSPQNPTDAQYKQLEAAGQLALVKPTFKNRVKKWEIKFEILITTARCFIAQVGLVNSFVYFRSKTV